MFLVTVINCRTGIEESHLARKVEMPEKPYFSFHREGEQEVHLYTGIFKRDDSAIVINTLDPIKIESDCLGHKNEKRFPNRGPS